MKKKVKKKKYNYFSEFIYESSHCLICLTKQQHPSNPPGTLVTA